LRGAWGELITFLDIRPEKHDAKTQTTVF